MGKSAKKVLVIVFFSVYSLSIGAQSVIESDTTTRDLRTRVGFELNRELYRGLSLTWEEEARFKNLSTEFDRLNSSLGLAYRVNDYFKFGASYTFMLLWHDGKKKTNYEKYIDLRHRVNFDVIGNYHVRQWKFTWRERPVITIRTDKPDLLEKANPQWTLRSKIAAEYSIFGNPLKPYLSFELSNTLNAPVYASGNYIDRIRTNLGLKWRLNSRSSFDFYYNFDVGADRDIRIDYKSDDVTIKDIYVTNERHYTHILGVVYIFDCQ